MHGMNVFYIFASCSDYQVKVEKAAAASAAATSVQTRNL
jgi:hypothetical protein